MPEYSFKLPDLGEGTVESEIVAWRVEVGDFVNTDQPLLDIMTDKATIEVTAPVTGTLISVAGEAGDLIAVGAELAVFSTAEQEPAEQALETVTAGDTSPNAEAAGDALLCHANVSGVVPIDPDATRETAPTSARPQTSPAIRRLAREQGIELNQVRGSGPNGRITRADIDQYLERSEPQRVFKTKAVSTGAREIKLTGLRRKVAEKMALSASRIPHFSYVEEADVTELERLRSRLNGTRQEDQPKLSYLPFLMQALVKVAQTFPYCNAHFDDENQVIRQFDPVHIGIAVQTERGLLVPVIRHAQTLDLWQCAAELKDIAERARNRRARKQELSGSTITLSSLGALGGIVSTPIINYPEVAIIGINRTRRRQVFEDGGVSNRLVMNISSSFDHRALDGYEAAQTIRALKGYLESPATLFLHA